MRPGIKGISRIAALVALAAAITATTSYLVHNGTWPTARTGAAAAPKDLLAPELARCSAIGMAAKDDAGCAAAWAASRRRFFDYSRPSPDEAAR